MAKRADPAVAFSKYSVNVQRAVLAVTHIENATLAFVVSVVERERRVEWWPARGNIDDYLMHIRVAVHGEQARALPRCKVVSLAGVRATKEAARGRP